MFKQKGTTLGCFSPPVMIATFAIEIILALYVIVRYKLNAKTRTIVALLVCLGVFQFAEYLVCTNSSVSIGAARAGYIAITLLPPLGLYLMSLLTKPLSAKTHMALVFSAAVFIGYFLLSSTAFSGYECTGNYVIFQIGFWQSRLYGLYYFGLIALAIIKGQRFLLAKPKAKAALPVQWFLIGYAMFIVPVAVLVVLQPDTRQAIPSILCGFAVTLAVILGTMVAPLTAKRR